MLMNFFKKIKMIFFYRSDLNLNPLILVILYVCITYPHINDKYTIYVNFLQFIVSYLTPYLSILVYLIVSCRGFKFTLYNSKLITVPQNRFNNNMNSLFLSMLYNLLCKFLCKSKILYMVEYIKLLSKYSFNKYALVKWVLNVANYQKSALWYNIFKRHSIFGFYKISSQK